MKKTNQIVGSVSVYGTSAVGFGYLAFAITPSNKVGGTGEPIISRYSGTAAIWHGLQDIKNHVALGLVEINYDFATGPRMAIVDLAKRWPTFGDLKWQEGRILTISAQQIEEAANG